MLVLISLSSEVPAQLQRSNHTGFDLMGIAMLEA